MRYSIFSLLRQALRGHRDWTPAWRDAVPKPALRRDHRRRWRARARDRSLSRQGLRHHRMSPCSRRAGSARATPAVTPPSFARTICCPAMCRSTNSRMQLWEGLEQDLNYNAMVSQRGVLNLYHSDAQRDAYARRGNAMRMHGIDAELLDRNAVRRMAPFLDFDNARFPIRGGLLQRRGGTARHDAVVWGYARGRRAIAASTSSRTARSPASFARPARITGVATTRGEIKAAEGWGSRSRVTPRDVTQSGGFAAAHRKSRSAGVRVGVDQAAHSGRHHVRCRTFLCEPVGQGRPGLRRRHRRLQLLRPTRQSAYGRRCVREAAWPSSRRSAACAYCVRGAG